MTAQTFDVPKPPQKHVCTCNKTKEKKAIPKLRIEILYCMDCEAIEFHTIKETTV